MLWFHLFYIFSKKYIKNVSYFCSIFYLQFLFYSHVDVFLLQPCFIYHFFYINVNSIKYIWLLFNFSWIMYNITLWKITYIFILQKKLFFVLICRKFWPIFLYTLNMDILEYRIKPNIDLKQHIYFLNQIL